MIKYVEFHFVTHLSRLSAGFSKCKYRTFFSNSSKDEANFCNKLHFSTLLGLIFPMISIILSKACKHL